MTAATAAVDGGVVDVVCLGESMVTFLPSRPGRLADVPSFARAIGGAESNVACALAAAGHSVKWVSRVGADGFGDHLIAAVAAYGVDVSAVRRDADRPTGVYFRTATDRATPAHEVVYYRAGSAASVMSPANVPQEDLDGARILHLSGMTAALSAECLALMRHLTARRAGRPLLSFDVNHRPGLGRDDPAVSLELACRADLLFVGEDEAAHAWGLDGPAAIREALPEPAVLVVKQGARGAVAYAREPEPCAPEVCRDTATRAPAPRVDVIDPVGAGDAFAAGFLSATLRALPVGARLRHGHLMAAAALTVPGDLGSPPPAGPPGRHDSAARDVAPLTLACADRLAALDDEHWGTLHLGPGWTTAAQATEEVRTA
nr:sugar kinase [Streptomyces sp. MNU89]